MVWAASRAEKNLNRYQYVGVGVARTAKEKGQGSWRKMDTGLYQKRQEWVEPEPEAEAWNRVEYAQDGFPG